MSSAVSAISAMRTVKQIKTAGNGSEQEKRQLILSCVRSLTGIVTNSPERMRPTDRSAADNPTVKLCSTGSALTSWSGLAHRPGEFAIVQINCRTLDCITSFVNDETEASVLKKERQAIAPGILVDAALAQTRDLSLAYFGMNDGRLDAETCSNGNRIDADRTLFKLDYCHVKTRPRPLYAF